MSIDEKTLDHIAHLAKLELTSDQKPSYLSAFNKILEAMGSLQALDTDHIAAFSQQEGSSVKRQDLALASDIAKSAESNAPEMNHGYFLVPQVIGE